MPLYYSLYFRKREERLDWMYSGGVTSAKSLQEDYLLGRRRIDDLDIPTVQQESVKQQDHSDVISRDMEQKLREDPLFVIRKQEYELTRSIIENPVHYKRIKAGEVIENTIEMFNFSFWQRVADILNTGHRSPSRRSDAASRDRSPSSRISDADFYSSSRQRHPAYEHRRREERRDYDNRRDDRDYRR